MAIKTYKKGSATKLSNNFRAREFDCPGSGCCKETKVDEKLAEYLQKIRNHFGKSITVEIGYRCPAFNAKVKNAAPKSKHTEGMAADIKIKGVAPAEIAKYAESLGIKGIGLYDTFVHIDTRASKFFWYSNAQEPRSTFGGAPKVKYSQAQFIKDIQKAFSAPVTGEYSTELLKKTITLSATKNRTHVAVGYVQKRLLALGYSQVGGIDGIAGAKFTEAVKAFQKDNKQAKTGRLPARSTYWAKLLNTK